MTNPINPLEPSDIPPIPPSEIPSINEPAQGESDTIGAFTDPDSFFITNASSFLPLPDDIDILTYLKLLGDSILEFQNELRVSTRSTLDQRALFRGAIVNVFQNFSLLLDALKDIVEEGEQLVDEANEDIDAVNQSTDAHNAALATDQQQLEAMQTVIDNYNTALQAWRDCASGCGALILAWVQAATFYNVQRASYNTYRNTRNPEIADYNDALGEYAFQRLFQNGDIFSYNQDHAQTPGFVPIHLMQGTNPDEVPELPAYSSVSIPGNPLSTDPNTLPLLDPISQAEIDEATTPVTKPPNLTFEGNLDIVNQGLLPFLIPALNFANQLVTVLDAQERFDPDDELESARDKLLPPAFFNQQTEAILKTDTGAGSNIGLTQVTLTANDAVLEGIISRSLIENVFRQQQLKLESSFFGQTQLILASVFGTNLLRAIPPGLSIISPQLPNVTANSPIFSIVFALSFSNRVQEIIEQGVLGGAIEDLIANAPQLQSLSAGQKADIQNDLSNTATTSFILVSAGLLARTLGLPSLVSQLLATFGILSPSQQKSLFSGEEDTLTLRQQQREDLLNRFVNQGFGPNEAQFLSATAVDNLNRGFINPLLFPITQDNLRVDALSSNLASGLVFKGIPSPRAQSIAEAAVQSVLGGGTSFNRLTSLRDALRTALRAEGVPGSTAEEVSNAADFEGNLTDPLANVPVGSLTPEQLINTVGERVSALLDPVLGSKLTGQIREEITRSLAGTEPAGIEAVKDEKTPFSLTSLLRDHRIADESSATAEAKENQAAAFQEKMAPHHNLYELERRMIDPANIYLFMYSSAMNLGLEPKEWKQSIDIQA